jgi:hypothetical protein
MVIRLCARTWACLLKNSQICTVTNEVFSIDQSCWPVIPRPECFPD